MRTNTPDSRPETSTIRLGDLIWTFISPLFIGKTLVMYFGLQYSCYPDQGYGWGLLASLALTVFTLTRFIWKYRHYTE